MDFTKIKCISQECKNQDITMDGAGGTFGSQMDVVKVRCPNCGLMLMIVPMKEDSEYIIERKK